MPDTDTPDTTFSPPDGTALADSRGGALGWLARCMAHESTPRDLVNLRRWLVWLLVWSAVAIPDATWFGYVDGETSWFTITQGVLVLAGLGAAIATFARYLRETDELNRLIQLRALAVGFAAALVSSEVGQAMLDAGLIESVDVDLPIIAMLLTWATASVVIQRRYR